MKKFDGILVKNYIILGIILLLTIFFSFYFYFWYSSYSNNKNNKSAFYNNLQNIQYNELDNFLVENKDAIVYFTGVQNTETINFEKKFNKLISKYFVNDHILYLNISKELEVKNVRNEINGKYGVNVPYIIIFKGSEIVSKYNIKENDYDINLLKDYLISEGIIHD